MAINTLAADLQIIRAADGLELDLEPLQGLWSEQQYLRLTDQTNHLVEFTDGVIEVLPMPTKQHQAISLFLLLGLLAFVRPRGGAVFYAPLRLAIRPGKFREPDLLLLLDKDDPRAQNEFLLGADLVRRLSAPTGQSGTPRRSRATTPRPGFPSTGSSTRSTRPLPCWCWPAMPMPCTAYSTVDNVPPRDCSPAST